MRRKAKSRPVRRTRAGFLTFEWLLTIVLLVSAVVLGFAAVRTALVNYLSPIPRCICVIDVECTPCDGAGCTPGECNCGRPPWWCEGCNGP